MSRYVEASHDILTVQHYFISNQYTWFSLKMPLIINLQVVWGKFSMVEAEKRLLANALLDPDNQHFVLLSDRSLHCKHLQL